MTAEPSTAELAPVFRRGEYEDSSDTVTVYLPWRDSVGYVLFAAGDAAALDAAAKLLAAAARWARGEEGPTLRSV